MLSWWGRGTRGRCGTISPMNGRMDARVPGRAEVCQGSGSSGGPDPQGLREALALGPATWRCDLGHIPAPIPGPEPCVSGAGRTCKEGQCARRVGGWTDGGSFADRPGPEPRADPAGLRPGPNPGHPPCLHYPRAGHAAFGRVHSAGPRPPPRAPVGLPRPAPRRPCHWAPPLRCAGPVTGPRPPAQAPPRRAGPPASPAPGPASRRPRPRRSGVSASLRRGGRSGRRRWAGPGPAGRGGGWREGARAGRGPVPRAEIFKCPALRRAQEQPARPPARCRGQARIPPPPRARPPPPRCRPPARPPPAACGLGACRRPVADPLRVRPRAAVEGAAGEGSRSGRPRLAGWGGGGARPGRRVPGGVSAGYPGRVALGGPGKVFRGRLRQPRPQGRRWAGRTFGGRRASPPPSSDPVSRAVGGATGDKPPRPIGHFPDRAGRLPPPSLPRGRGRGVRGTPPGPGPLRGPSSPRCPLRAPQA